MFCLFVQVIFFIYQFGLTISASIDKLVVLRLLLLLLLLLFITRAVSLKSESEAQITQFYLPPDRGAVTAVVVFVKLYLFHLL